MAIFFSQRKPREFAYRPRYYDPAQEEREQRKKVVLGERYKSPQERTRIAAGQEGTPANYVPGSILREHIAARRGVSAAESMRKRRRKGRSVAVCVGILVLVGVIMYMMYFK